jgi:nitrile hydratase
MTATTNAERTEALEALLIERGLISPNDVDRVVERYQNEVGPLAGAGLVARAWTEADFRARLLADADAVLDELDLRGAQTDHLVVLENSADVHNVVVCTLCSCYPWAVLGLPPAWYKDFAYRSRVVREPRAVLAEMGLELDADTEIRVWDSSAEVRYMVLPERPEGTAGWSLEELVPLVSRDSMIGVSRAVLPSTERP